MFKRVLVAVDGSPTANRGLKCAIELAADQHAKLYIIHVIDDMAIAPSMDGGLFPAEYFDKMIESMRVAGRKLIAEAKKLALERGLEVQAAFVETLGQRVAQTIVAEASKQNADLIVLGTHGRRGLRPLVLGSDAESVLRDSPVPVLLVRSPEREKPHANPVKQNSATPSVLRPTGDGPSHAAERAPANSNADTGVRDGLFADQTVVVHFNYGSQDLRPLFALADKLDTAIKESGVGVYAGHQIAVDRSDGYLYMYGPDADALFRAVEPILDTTPFARGAKIKQRYGPPGANTKESALGTKEPCPQ